MAGFGDRVEVVRPAEARDHLARLDAALPRRYGGRTEGREETGDAAPGYAEKAAFMVSTPATSAAAPASSTAP